MAIKKLSAFVLFFGLSVQAMAVEPSSILNTEDRKKIQIGREATVAIRLFDPLFKLLPFDKFPERVDGIYYNTPDKSPMAAIGDFNGDKKKDDLLLFGSSGEKIKLILVVLEKGHYKVVSVRTWDTPTYDESKRWLQYVNLATESERKDLKVKGSQDVMKLELLYGPVTYYVYSDGKVQEIEFPQDPG